MQIAIIKDDNVVKIGDFRTLFPYTIFPDSGPSDDWMLKNSCKKVNLFKPHDQETELLEPCIPYIEGDWVYTVQVRNKTQQELQSDLDSKAARIRATRNMLLKDSDWTQGKDISNTISTPWAQYRQQLREIPQQEGFPTEVDWPIPPSS